MAATFATFVLLALLKVSTCSPVKPSTVEERIQRLEDAAELQYEFTNNIDERLSVLETFVAELLHGNSTDAHFNGTLSKTDLGNLQQKLSQQLFSRANDSMSMLTGNAAMRAAGDSRVAFHAYASNNRQLNNNQGIVYDANVVNYGGGYTASDGIFDVPVSGVYVFTWTISTSRFYHPITTHLIVDGVTRGILTTDSDGSSSIVGAGSHPATGVVVIYAPAGKHVFIKAVNLNTGTGTLESNELIRSTFSGWLLF